VKQPESGLSGALQLGLDLALVLFTDPVKERLGGDMGHDGSIGSFGVLQAVVVEFFL
jgi:hypothetical protein